MASSRPSCGVLCGEESDLCVSDALGEVKPECLLFNIAFLKVLCAAAASELSGNFFFGDFSGALSVGVCSVEAMVACVFKGCLLVGLDKTAVGRSGGETGGVMIEVIGLVP